MTALGVTAVRGRALDVRRFSAARLGLSSSERRRVVFGQLLTRRCFHFVTQQDEDAAQQRLKQYLYAVRGSPIMQTLDLTDWSGVQTMAA